MARFRFNYRGLMCDTYEPYNKTATEAAVLLYGFPATIGENAATELLRTCGFLVLQPHYPGTYDSDGVFTPQSAIAAVKILQEALAEGEVHDVKRNSTRSVPTTIAACVGYSFGSIIALRALPYFTKLRSLVLAAPAITYGPASVPSGFHEDGPDFLDYVQRSRPFTYRLGERKEWLELYNGQLNQAAGASPNSLRSIIGLVGTEDSSFDLTILRKNFGAVISQYVGNEPDVDLLVVKGGGHSVNSLLTEDTVPKVVPKLL